MDTQVRSVAKAVLCTGLGLVILAIVGCAFAGSLAIGGLMALISCVIGLAAYTAYERDGNGFSEGRLHA